MSNEVNGKLTLVITQNALLHLSQSPVLPLGYHACCRPADQEWTSSSYPECLTVFMCPVILRHSFPDKTAIWNNLESSIFSKILWHTVINHWPIQWMTLSISWTTAAPGVLWIKDWPVSQVGVSLYCYKVCLVDSLFLLPTCTLMNEVAPCPD